MKKLLGILVLGLLCFNINRDLCKKNVEIRNSKKSTDPKEFRSALDKGSIFYKIKKRFKIKSPLCCDQDMVCSN